MRKEDAVGEAGNTVVGALRGLEGIDLLDDWVRTAACSMSYCDTNRGAIGIRFMTASFASLSMLLTRSVSDRVDELRG